VQVVNISSWLFWWSCAPGKRLCGVAKKILAPPYYRQRAVFASFSERFFNVSILPRRLV